jgi:hypothetical protein
MIQYKRLEEQARSGGVPADVLMHKFSHINALLNFTDFLKKNFTTCNLSMYLMKKIIYRYLV